MNRLFISAVLFLFWMGANSFVFAHTPLKGIWVLKNIETQQLQTMSIAAVEKASEELANEIPEELRYTCPDKIVFDDEDFSCTLYYGNEVEKQARYYQAPGESSIFFSIKGRGSVPEKQFFLERSQESDTFMQLKYSKPEKNTAEEEYVYHYQLQK